MHVGAEQTEFRACITFGGPHLFVGCAIRQTNPPNEMETNVRPIWTFQEQASSWFSNGAAKNGLQDLPKNLADSSGQLGHERGAFKADGKPDVLMGQGLLAQLAERAVNRPELALSTT